MRHRFEDSLNVNIVNWKVKRKIDSITTWSSRKAEFLSKIASFLSLKFECVNYIFPIPSISFPFKTLESTVFKCFAKIMGRNYVFDRSSHVLFSKKISKKKKMLNLQEIKVYIATVSFIFMLVVKYGIIIIIIIIITIITNYIKIKSMFINTDLLILQFGLLFFQNY